MTNRTLTGIWFTNMRLTRVTMTAFFIGAMLAISIICGHPSSPTENYAHTRPNRAGRPRADDEHRAAAANNARSVSTDQTSRCRAAERPR